MMCRGNRTATRLRPEDAESGQVTLLIVGFVVLSLLVVTVMMAASGVYIGHRKLQSVADGAALAAADTFALGTLTDISGAPVPVLDRAAVRDSTYAYLSSTNAFGRLDSLSIDQQTGTPESRTARVVLSAVVHPPVVNFLIPDGVPISASSEARSQMRR